MRILHILPYSPLPASFGGALRIVNLLKHMSSRHEVDVVYVGRPGSDRAIADAFDGRLRRIVRVERPWTRSLKRLNQAYALASGRSHFNLLGYSDALQRAIDRMIATADYDVIQQEFSHMASFRLDSPAVRILDAHNVEYDLHHRQAERSDSAIRRFHYRQEARKIHREEISAWGRQDLIFTTSGRDLDLIAADVPAVPKMVLPNGVDSGYFSPSDYAPEPDSLVFTGLMRYLPNADGVRWFLREVLPHIRAEVPGVKTTIVGADPPRDLRPSANDGVTFTGRVPDVRPFVDRAAVSIVPLLMGGGTRLKIVEAFAMRKPVVSTTLGAEGLDVIDGENILLADEPRAFAAAVVSLLGDARLRKRLAVNAYLTMLERYEWNVIGRVLDQGYQAALDARRGGARASSYARFPEGGR